MAQERLGQEGVLFLSRNERGRRLAFISIGQVSLFAGFALFTAAVVGGSGYVIREAHRQVAIASAVAGLPTPPSVTPDMLRVSAIALGHVPMAVVNGVLVSEGAMVQLQTPEGTAPVRVKSIKDGNVEFAYGGETISVGLGPALRPSK